jgi:hypothetical protein
MQPTKVLLGALLLAAAFAPLAQAEAQGGVSTQGDRQDLGVTIYNDNLGLVRDTRELTLRGGIAPLRFSDVAAGIDATSVSFRPLKGAPVSVLEQNYEYDLITPAKLMEKYVGKEVEIRMPAAGPSQPPTTVTATLLSTNDGYVYRIGDKIYLEPPGQVVLPDLPRDLVARPSLAWLLDAPTAGTRDVEVSYLTSGMSWQADYVVVSRADNTRADINGWVTLHNTSGAAYPDAHLTLVAGDVHRAEAPRPMMMAPMAAREEKDSVGGSQFTQAALFEYHAYDLGRQTTLKNNQTKQLSLFNALDAATRKVFVFDSSRAPYLDDSGQGKQKVQVMLEVWNKANNHMGMPLPKGRVRVYQQDTAGKLQFIGEDNIDHTPKDELVRVQLGNAFDVVGERRQTSFKRLSAHASQWRYEIDLRNHKDAAVPVSVIEHAWDDWHVVSQSDDFIKRSATELEFPVTVPANGEKKVSYTVEVDTP